MITKITLWFIAAGWFALALVAGVGVVIHWALAAGWWLGKALWRAISDPCREWH